MKKNYIDNPINLRIASVYESLATSYEILGKYELSLINYKEVIKIKEYILGDDNKEVAATYANLAWLYTSKGEYQSALNMFSKAIKIEERELGSHNLTISISYNNPCKINIPSLFHKFSNKNSMLPRTID